MRTEVIEIYDDPDADHPTRRWTGFIFRHEREVLRRREKDGLALEFTNAELVALMREIQLFGETAQRARHATNNMLTLVPTHAACIEAPSEPSVYSHSYPRTAPVGANLSGPQATLTGGTWCGPVSFAPPAATPGPSSGYDQLMASCVRLGPLLTSSVMVAQLLRPSGPPPGCPLDGCHHFWASGSSTSGHPRDGPTRALMRQRLRAFMAQGQWRLGGCPASWPYHHQRSMRGRLGALRSHLRRDV